MFASKCVGMLHLMLLYQCLQVIIEIEMSNGLHTLPWDNPVLFPQQFFWCQCHHFLGFPFLPLLQIPPPP